MPRGPQDSIYAETYKDLRSQRRIRNRLSKQSAKYYGYRGVHSSWVDQQYLSVTRSPQPYFYPNLNVFASCAPLVIDATDMKVSTWTKRDMWLDRDVDIWPLDRRHHKGRRIREKYCWKWNELEMGRRMRQKARYLDLAVEDGESLAADDGVGTVYWELDDLWREEVDEIFNDRGERPPLFVDLDGERRFEGISNESSLDEADGSWERELIESYCDTGDGDDFSIISEQEIIDAMSSTSMEDDYEMV
ncbi:uncharacterized protein A1O5_02109 [Cladophialophora psammophila CBS 110553]|uniref:Uncharacterized protein n=1 Tax=Cladophialophora psammophila CBS 110553 TaxID=1182543 RepID=W9X5F0_9EURO|nr:uncharacterized protein A1O5_02109 [Cladophialophora psammophila CBS 110553]EXJ75413.1 hypothetical protein A1O5_02109 [Cladophialophora psammophila CBS 110553]